MDRGFASDTIRNPNVAVCPRCTYLALPYVPLTIPFLFSIKPQVCTRAVV